MRNMIDAWKKLPDSHLKLTAVKNAIKYALKFRQGGLAYLMEEEKRLKRELGA